MILTPAPSTGLWTTGDGEEIEAPCPGTLGERARLPRGCGAPEAGVLISRAAYINQEGEFASLRAEVQALESQIEAEREARRVAEGELKEALSEHALAVKILQSTCTQIDCPQVKPALIGGVFALTTCGAIYTTYQIMK